MTPAELRYDVEDAEVKRRTPPKIRRSCFDLPKTQY
jgi:hypothetical protein|tara:strand:+ start:190 stop:297 length:108 start_codon:yes stop_codon:yes gene_type:complete